MAHIDYYFATISPYTYLAGQRLDAILAKHGATVRYKPCDIMQLFARTGGTPPKDRHPNRIAYRAQDLVRRAKALGMPFNLQPAHWPTNMAPSSYAIISAQDAGGGDLSGLVHAICRACWAEDKDVAADGVIRAALAQAGYDAGLADSGLLQGAEQYAANLEEAVNAGAFGAPFYIVRETDQRFWGQDSLELLDMHLAGAV